MQHWLTAAFTFFCFKHPKKKYYFILTKSFFSSSQFKNEQLKGLASDNKHDSKRLNIEKRLTINFLKINNIYLRLRKIVLNKQICFRDSIFIHAFIILTVICMSDV